MTAAPDRYDPGAYGASYGGATGAIACIACCMSDEPQSYAQVMSWPDSEL